ncbi:MAG: bifunctional diaminohydroxyphosphoribosylaminopyrimidine deaminase/5-amino-6-(5-phosphoribosylamino)uracil reductase RibD [Planctomycetota bacterium]
MPEETMRFSESDRARMRTALELARKGLGAASPNPAVGCVIVKHGRVAGEGFTQAFGGPHAEPVALLAAGETARGATAYVTLMPCAHRGKTGPCTDALIQAGVVRVVAAVEDPDPVSLDGASVLRAAGVAVETGLLADEALSVIDGFVKHLRTGLPVVRLKFAMTLDGKTATRAGESRWISSPEAREQVQILRAESDAALVGAGTVLLDNPRLNVRDASRWQPRRVVADSRCRTPLDARLFSEPGGEVVILTTASSPPESRKALEGAGARVLVVPEKRGRVDLTEGLKALAGLGVRSVLCEGGGTLAGALFDAGLVDEVIVYVAPKILGGEDAPSPVEGEGFARMADALLLTHVVTERVGPDLCLRGRVGEWGWIKESSALEE